MNLNNIFSKEINEPQTKNHPSYWFIYRNDEILVYSIEKNQCTIPFIKTPQELGINLTRSQFLGKYKGKLCYSGEVCLNTTPPQNMIFLHPLTLFNYISLDFFKISGYAFQIMKWDQNFQYCGRCGNKTITHKSERAKICENCNLISYPRISPAVIMAVIKEDTILLAKSGRFKRDMHSILAGFVDAGETLEESVHREIKEEVNIEVENLRYFGSQPWPFPDSLMIGFIADYKCGEIKCDGMEIISADWYKPDNLPTIPGKISIARELIDWFIRSYS